MSPLLGLQETAEYFGYSTSWVMLQIRINKLPAYRVGNKWRFIPADLETWVRKQPHKIRAVNKKQGNPVFRFGGDVKALSSKSLSRRKKSVSI